jgi:RNA polymerase II subunit A small phosphatase-like protein
MAKPDLKLDIVVDRTPITVLVKKRPGVERFLLKMAEFYEVVLFTASLRDYAVPVMEKIDPTRVCEHHIYRQGCTPHRNVLVKDMSLLGRNLKDSIIIDNSENSFMFQPMNALHIKNFFEDESDTELDRLTPFLEFLSQVNDSRPVHTWMDKFDRNDTIDFVNMQNQKDIWDKENVKFTEIVVDTPSTTNDSALNLSRTRSRSSDRSPSGNGTQYIRRNSHQTYTQGEEEDYEEGPKEKDALLDHTSPPTSPTGKKFSTNNKVESLRYINSGKNINSPLQKGKVISDLV